MSSNPLRSLRLIPKSPSELSRLSGSVGEIFLDKTTQSLRVFTGHQLGGYALLRADLSNLETTGGSNVDFGTKTLIAQEFQGTLVGNVTGQVSDISNHSLSDLSDVLNTAPLAGQLLGFNGANWTPITLSGSFNGGSISGSLAVNNVTDSTSTSTGALTTTGGLGVSGSAFIGGSTTVTGSVTAAGVVSSAAVQVRGNNRLRLYDTDNSNFVGLRAPTNLTADVTFILPATAGTAGQYLQTNGSGGLAWATVTGGSGGGTSNPPGGSDGYIQYNSGGSFGGSSSLTYDSNTDIVSVSNLTASVNLTSDTINATTITATGTVSADIVSATSVDTTDVTATGTISGDITSSNVTITGGSVDGTTVGETTRSSGKFTTIAANNSATFTKGTNSNSTTSGTVVVTGGMGVSQDVFIGGQVSVNTTITAAGDITTSSNVVVNNAPVASTHVTNKQYVDSRSVAMAVALS